MSITNYALAKHHTPLRPVIRVFVSSTFRGKKSERNGLRAQAITPLEHLVVAQCLCGFEILL